MNPKTIDTHSHLQFDAFKKDLPAVVAQTLAKNIWAINVGTDFATSAAAVAFTQKYGQGFYAAVGLHPTEIDEGFDKEKYEKLAQSKKVVAIGEIGLDYFRKPFDAQKQKRIFIQQLDLAKELNLPIIIHCRAAHNEMIEILQTRRQKGVIHCFTGTLEQAKKYIDIGFYLGIGGIIFKFNIDEVIQNIPIEYLLLETDCPYLTPLQEKGKRNEPVFMFHTIEKIAELKNISVQKVIDATTKNAKTLFNI